MHFGTKSYLKQSQPHSEQAVIGSSPTNLIATGGLHGR